MILENFKKRLIERRIRILKERNEKYIRWIGRVNLFIQKNDAEIVRLTPTFKCERTAQNETITLPSGHKYKKVAMSNEKEDLNQKEPVTEEFMEALEYTGKGSHKKRKKKKH